MKATICWATVSGYTAACWRALASRPGVRLTVVSADTTEADPNAPFSALDLSGVDAHLVKKAELWDEDFLPDLVHGCAPDVVVVCGWFIRGFRRLLFDPRLRRCRFVMAIDTPLQLTWRQWLGRFALRRVLKRVDRMIVAGERAAALARYYGFPPQRIRQSTYGIDYDLFNPVFVQRSAKGAGWPRKFLFVGRYVPVKGIEPLLQAYQLYRQGVADPWPLTFCGTGPLGERIRATPGVTDLGFLQPEALPGVFSEHAALVLPSIFEPWGQVIVEAMAAGLPVIATSACGASVEMVRSYHNGLVVPPDDPKSLAAALRWVHENARQIPDMAGRASVFAQAYAADLWAQRWHAIFEELV
jgi:glycosyltransferase involved in cell wall biosynthesis